MKAEDAKRLKHLEKQNPQLKKLVAEAELEKAVLKELAERNFRDRRVGVGAWLRDYPGHHARLGYRRAYVGARKTWESQ